MKQTGKTEDKLVKAGVGARNYPKLCGLHGDLVALGDDAVVLVHVDELGMEFLQLNFVVHRVSRDDDDVAWIGLVRRRTIYGDHSRTALRPNCIGGETLAIGDIVDVDLLVFPDVGSIQQVVVDRA